MMSRWLFWSVMTCVSLTAFLGVPGLAVEINLSQWGDDFRLSEDAIDSESPSVLQLQDGTLAVFWKNVIDPEKDAEILFSSSNAEGEWSPAQVVVPSGTDKAGVKVHVSPSGRLQLVYSDSGPGNFELFHMASDDNGAIWTSATRLSNAKGSSWNTNLCSFGNHLYCIWDDGRDAGILGWSYKPAVYFRSSYDDGQTWNDEVRVSSKETSFAWAPRMLVDEAGTLHVMWHDERDGAKELYYDYSTDGGVTWHDETAVTEDDDTTSDLFRWLLGPDGNIHLLWVDRIADNDPGIYYRRSVGDISSGVSAWTDLIRLATHELEQPEEPRASRAGRGYVRHQGTPSCVFVGGVLHVVWSNYLVTEKPGGEVHDSWVHWIYSMDYGETWADPQTVSHYDSVSKDLCCLEADGRLVLVWSDNRNDNLEIYSKALGPTYDLSIEVEGTGTTEPQSGAHQYEAATVVELSASADSSGWRFEGWEGDLTSTENPVTILIDSDKTVRAVFSQRPCPLTLSVIGEGTCEPVPGTHEVLVNTPIDIVAIPAKNHHFVSWAGSSDASIADPNLAATTVSCTDEATVAATFAIDTHEVVFTASAGGSVTGRTTQTIDHGAGCSQVTAIPDDGYKFDGWSGDVVETGNPLVVEDVTADMAIRADFTEMETYTVDVESTPAVGVTITGLPGGETNYTSSQLEQSELRLTAPELYSAEGQDYFFSHWSVDGIDQALGQEDLALTATGDTKLVATYLRSLGDAAVLFEPSGLVIDSYPTFSWGAAVGAERYQIWIERYGEYYCEQRLQTQTYWVPSWLMKPGCYEWWIQTWREGDEVGTWSDGLTFTLDPFRPADVPMPLTPWGVISDAHPEFIWTDAVGATWYQVSIRKEGNWDWITWVQDDTSWSPSGWFLDNGNYEWWVQAWSVTDGYSDWSEGMSFSVEGISRVPTPLAPSGVTAQAQPEFTWTEAIGAAWYQISIRKEGDWDWTTWVQDDTSWSPSGWALDNGNYEWWVQAWSVSDGYSDWSEGMSFSVEGISRVPTPLAPSDLTAQAQPEFRWTEVADATWYQIFIRKEGDWEWTTWVQGSTSWSPSGWAFDNGNYEWWVQSWSVQAGYGNWSKGMSFTFQSSSER